MNASALTTLLRLKVSWPSAAFPRIGFNRQLTLALVALIVSLGVWGWVTQQTQINWLSPASLQNMVGDSGKWGPFIYIALLAVSVVISQIPGLPLAIAAGAVWGPTVAGVYSVIGGFIGSLIAYSLGKTLGRSAIKAVTGKVIYFSKQRGEGYLGWLIFITRLLPIFSFDLISYGAGVTGLSLPTYASATFFGMAPSTFLLTYMGSTLTLSAGAGLVLSGLFVTVLIGLPWAMHRYNWFNLKEIVQIE
ncbi:MAG: TVP38/TMEM64 family protein [Leptolyngbyaceae cyanobacterium MO_188.B28]|nr:TVP38/TMEM64 family protein [Leptolyngbyaceae cyanobacterium MO_188.B28]